MSISVVIPAYKAAGTIRRAVESVIRQTSPPDQILVIDDGSPDGDALAQALDSYGPSVTLLRKSNGGAASARNYGIDHARCEWVAFLDADDYWESDKLERQLAVALRHPEVAVIGCRSYDQLPEHPRTPGSARVAPYCGRLLRTQGPEAFELACAVWTGSLLVRRSTLEPERFDCGLGTAEDRDLWVRLVVAHPVYILPDFLATAVLEPGSLSRTDPDRDSGCMLKVVYRYSDLLGPAGVRERVVQVYRSWAWAHLSLGQSNKALPHALRRLRLQPISPEAWWVVCKAATLAIVNRVRAFRSGPNLS